MGKKAIMIAVGSSMVLCSLCVTFLLLLRGLEPRKRDRVETVTVVPPPIQAKRMMENSENEEEFPSEPRFLLVANSAEKSNIENVFYSRNTTSQGFRRNNPKNKTINQGYYENSNENQRHLKENASDSQSLSNILTCRMPNLSFERNNDRDDKENENIPTEASSQNKRSVVQIISSKPEVNTNNSGTLTTE